MKQEPKMKKSTLHFSRVMIFACLLLPIGVTGCSSDEEDVHYTAEVLSIESSQNYGRAKIIHSAKDDKLSEILRENDQFGNKYVDLEIAERPTTLDVSRLQPLVVEETLESFGNRVEESMEVPQGTYSFDGSIGELGGYRIYLK